MGRARDGLHVATLLDAHHGRRLDRGVLTPCPSIPVCDHYVACGHTTAIYATTRHTHTHTHPPRGRGLVSPEGKWRRTRGGRLAGTGNDERQALRTCTCQACKQSCSDIWSLLKHVYVAHGLRICQAFPCSDRAELCDGFQEDLPGVQLPTSTPPITSPGAESFLLTPDRPLSSLHRGDRSRLASVQKALPTQTGKTFSLDSFCSERLREMAEKAGEFSSTLNMVALVVCIGESAGDSVAMSLLSPRSVSNNTPGAESSKSLKSPMTSRATKPLR